MRVEKQLDELEREMKALKSSFIQSATQMNIYTTKLTFTTQVNECTLDWTQSFDYQNWMRLFADYSAYHTKDDNWLFYCDESVVVTYRSQNGSNVIANLEIEGNKGALYARRVPFNGGAQWILRIGPNVTGVLNPDGVTIDYWTWAPTVLNLAVQSGIPGTLEAKMIWE